MATPFTLQFIVSDTEAQMLLRDFLLQNKISRTALTDIKYHGGKITVNGNEETVRHILQAGDYVMIQFPVEPKNERMKSEPLPLQIVYEDDTLLLAEKPSGMSTIPSREHPSGTLANAIAYYYRQSGHSGAVHFVTRLDYDTSGLVLIAKHRHIHHLLSLAQQQNTITKEYLAMTQGIPIPAKGRIDLPIARVSDSIIKREVRTDGQPASTLYHTEQTVYINNQAYTLIRLQLLTGRTHQIRVHMTALGHPLLGDSLYGGDCTFIHRQALHCARLAFSHPITGKPLQFESPLPKDIQRILHLHQ